MFSSPSTWVDPDTPAFEVSDYGWICGGCVALLPPAERYLEMHLRFHGIVWAPIIEQIIARFNGGPDE